jgi:hypothetical protein
VTWGNVTQGNGFGEMCIQGNGIRGYGLRENVIRENGHTWKRT